MQQHQFNSEKKDADDPLSPNSRITVDRFMKEKTLLGEHQKFFSNIDNIVEEAFLKEDNDIFNEE